MGDQLQNRWGCSLAGTVGTKAIQGSALAVLENKGEDSGIFLLQLPKHEMSRIN